MSNLFLSKPRRLAAGLTISLFSLCLGTITANAFSSKNPADDRPLMAVQQSGLDGGHIRLAHVAIMKRIPAKNGVIDGTINVVEIWFTSAVDREKTSIAVIDPGNKRIDDARVKHGILDPGHVTVGVNNLRDGQYKVRYRALASDGHTVSGSYKFTVRRAVQNTAVN